MNDASDAPPGRNPHRQTVLDLVRRTAETVSRADIARALGVSRSTASAIVDDLITAGLIQESGTGVSKGGRRPIALQIRPEAGRVVGVDLGATHARTVVADLRGQALAESMIEMNVAAGPRLCLEQVDALVAATLKQAGCALAGVLAFGVGVPGPVDIRRGMVLAPPIMPGWDGFPIRDSLERAWARPVMVDNDADLCALGEHTFGAARSENNLAYIKLGTGIGCGILIDGRIYHGVLGTAGEIGHVTVSLDGPPCTCGNYGCLEAMAGGRAIAQRARLAVQAGQRTALAQLDETHAVTARDVIRAAAAGDLVSQQLLADAGRHIGSALASLINLLNPGLLLIGGGLTDAGPYLLDPIRAAVRERSLSASRQAVRMQLAQLGRRSAVMGCVALALDSAFAQLVAGQRTLAAPSPEAS